VQLERRQIIAYIALGVVVLAIGGRAVLGGRQTPTGTPLVLAAAPSSVSPAASPGVSTSPAVESRVVVYVCGAVRTPGVYELPASARVGDAIERAGGAAAKAELAAVNLAAMLTDGQQIVVPERGAAGAVPAVVAAAGAAGGAAGAAGAPAAIVNLNTATLEQLDTLSGVGPSTAQKIVDYRTANGGFKTIDELKNVPGIGDVRFAALKDFISV